MTTAATKLKQLRWYQWLFIAVAFIYLVYVALSYFYVPNKLKQVVEEDVAELLGRELSVAPIEFNPFDLSVRIKAFSIADKSETPLLSWQEFYVNFTPWGSLFSWNLQFEDLLLDQPSINIEKRGDRFNFSDILERLSASEEPEQPDQAPLKIALEVIQTSINDGVFRFTDFSGEKPAKTEMDEITIQIKEIYLATGDEHLNPFNINATVPGGGSLQLQGEYRIDPLYVDANIKAEGIELKEYSDFVTNVVPVSISDGALALETKLLVEQKQDLELNISQGKLQVDNFALDDKVLDPAMLRIQTIVANGIEMDVLKQRLSIDEVSVNDVVANQWLDQEGNLRIQALLVEEVVEKNVEKMEQEEKPVPEEKSGSEWDLFVKKISYNNGLLNFTDQNEKITKAHSISGIEIDLENLTLTENKRVPISVLGVINESGKIEVAGELTLVPFAMELNYQFNDIQLAPFSEYVEMASYLRIEKGAVSINGNMNLSTEGEVPISSELALEINGFQAEDMRTGKPILNFDNIKVDGASLDTQNKQFNMNSLVMTVPELLVARSEQQEINWATLAKSEKVEEVVGKAGAQVAEKANPQGEQDWQYSIGEVRLENGNIRFEDRGVKPMFKTELASLNVALEEVASDKKEPTPFAFSSKIDRYAPFTIKGKLDPVAQQPGFEFKSQLKGLEMHSLSPYSAQFIAHNLESGKLDLDLQYGLHENKLKGKNSVVAKNLYLGEEVPSEDAIDAPVGLGLALLRDVNGVIDVDVGVSGDLSDPGFSVSGIIIKAFINVIVKAVSSPFSLLGSLVGGREDLGEFEFEAGRSDLGDEDKQRLQQLVEALKQRPQLAIHITGNAEQTEDTPELQKLKVQDVVASNRKISLVELREEAGEVDWWTVRANRRELNKLNDQLKLTELDDREDQIKAAQPGISGDALEGKVYQAMYADVWANQPIGTAELLSLADRRALAIKQYLVDELGFEFERVSVTKAKAKKLNSRTINLQIEAK